MSNERRTSRTGAKVVPTGLRGGWRRASRHVIMSPRVTAHVNRWSAPGWKELAPLRRTRARFVHGLAIRRAPSGGWFQTMTSSSPLLRFLGAARGKRFPAGRPGALTSVCRARSCGHDDWFGATKEAPAARWPAVRLPNGRIAAAAGALSRRPRKNDGFPGSRPGCRSDVDPATTSPTSPTQHELCRFSLFSTTQVIELLNPCTPNSPQYRL